MASDSARFQAFRDDEASINKKLPKELLLRIFSFLDVVSLCRCAQVSKAWNVLALDGSNWQRIDLFAFQKDVEGPVIENISRRCGGFLRKLSLRGCQSVGDGSMKTLALLCQNIEDLNVNDCKKVLGLQLLISDTICTALSRHCHKLQRLNLDGCPLITDKSLKALSDGCVNLTTINISWCSNITENGVEALARGCPKLTCFIAKGCEQITSRGVICLARYCSNLEVMNLMGCGTIRDEAVQALAERCPKLHYLCLSSCSALTDASLLALAQYSTMLSTLEVAGCAQFTDAGFLALARVRSRSGFSLAQALMGRLHVSELPLFRENGLGWVRSYYRCHVNTFGDGMSTNRVFELDNCPLVTDASLEYLTSCHNLQRIELYDCQLITRAGIKRLRNYLPMIKVHAYFAPVTPPPMGSTARSRYCRCCAIL
ncbi:hypothetical protein D910_02477 [Dendroctonus ponderosae]|uniref:F-box domain-containing protein n=1 Tax=Dendroctonus ponderosae TaxID=77166 RepID=U4TU19_DENPD|nr:hypothetical protein D910_02477 [Dendroctonus ponderosae]